MNKQDRINYIRIMLLKRKRILVSELSKLLKVSERTIRRDLKELESRGIASLFFGGAVLIDMVKENTFDGSRMSNIESNFNNKRKLTKSSDKLNIDNEHIGVYVLGSFNIDIVSEVKSFPRSGETIHSLSTSLYPGGKGSNQATAAAKINKHVHLTIKVGKDEFGAKAKNHLTSTEINSFTILEDNENNTGSAIVLISRDDGDNMITLNLGANREMKLEEISNELPLIQDAKVFLTQLENNFSTTKFAIEYASRTNSIVILNPAPVTHEVKEILHLVDIVTLNQTEAENLSGIQITDIDSAKEAATIIHRMGPVFVIITLGTNGCILYDGNEYKGFDAYESVVVDTSGAGDSFNGSLAGSLANGMSLDNAIRHSLAFSSLAVEYKGASNMPDNQLVMGRMGC